jgi:hypothetical protein
MPTSTLPIFPQGINNPYKCQASLAGAQSVNSGAITKVLLDTVLYDTSGDGGTTGGFSTANSNYKIVAPGYYEYKVVVAFGMAAQAAAQQTFSTAVYKNGASVVNWQVAFQQPAAGGNASNNSAPVAHSSFFAAGDVIDVRFLWTTSGAAVAINLLVGTGSTVFAIHLLST